MGLTSTFCKTTYAGERVNGRQRGKEAVVRNAPANSMMGRKKKRKKRVEIPLKCKKKKEGQKGPRSRRFTLSPEHLRAGDQKRAGKDTFVSTSTRPVRSQDDREAGCVKRLFSQPKKEPAPDRLTPYLTSPKSAGAGEWCRENTGGRKKAWGKIQRMGDDGKACKVWLNKKIWKNSSEIR